MSIICWWVANIAVIAVAAVSVPARQSSSPAVSTTGFCNNRSLPALHQLRANKLTILVSGFSEVRLHLLRSVSIAYSSIPIVSSVQILWSNPRIPIRSIRRVLDPFPVHFNPSASLNSRFLPLPTILTRAVAVADDDVQIPASALSFAFSVFNTQPHRLLGFFPRSHDLDLTSRRWIYTAHPDRYSIVLTKFLMMSTAYMYQYSCLGGKKMTRLRRIVERKRNCEDILINFMVAEWTRTGPLLVEGRGIRDWGDVRNQEEAITGRAAEKISSDSDWRGGVEFIPVNNNNNSVSGVGLSKRPGHWKLRGDCITDFHRVLGKMPLRYSYEKLTADVGGEHSLCHKGGKSVPCDS